MEQAIITKKGKENGPLLTVFAGIHGNETAGVLALKRAIEALEIARGTVSFVFANPPAISSDKRQIDKNLNRCFLKNNTGTAWEDQRARELMQLLDGCDALLDLHASFSKNSTPFIICEREAFTIARILNFDIISFGWDKLQPGAADGYMHNLNKPALCLECGAIDDFKKNVKLAYDSIILFLDYFGCRNNKLPQPQRQQSYIEVVKPITKLTKRFKFTRPFNDFDKLSAGEIFAADAVTEYRANKNELIIFPNPAAKVGEEACYIGKKIKP